MSSREREEGSREILPLRVKDERERQRILREGDNSYQWLVTDQNIPRCLTKKADLAVLVGLAHQVSPEEIG